MAVVFPHEFRDGAGNVASGVEVMANLDALKRSADASEAAIADIADRWSANDLRGKCIIAAESSFLAGVNYATMPVPDVVEDVVLPADGLLTIGYHGMWKAPYGAQVTLFLNETEVVMDSGARLRGVYAERADRAGVYMPLATSTSGLLNSTPEGTVDYQDPVSTGQVVGLVGWGTSGSAGIERHGGMTSVFAAAGTYDVSVRYASLMTPGTIYAKQRKLWVEARGF